MKSRGLKSGEEWVLAENQWKCSVCGTIPEGGSSPEVCPVCGAKKEQLKIIL